MTSGRRFSSRTRMSRAAVGCTAISVVLLAACSGPTAPAPTTEVPPAAPDVIADGSTLFRGADSPWTVPVAGDAAADPDSARYVARLLTETPLISVRQWTAPVYLADAATPRFTVSPTADYVPDGTTFTGVPIPPDAQPDPGTDGHLAVIDKSTNCVYELYQAKQEGNGWTADWINATPADGTGIYPDGNSTRGSGFSVAAGLIWPQELQAGKINHALVFSYPYTRSGDPVGWATKNDGRSDDPDALPEGARLVLDPTLDLTTLGLPRDELTIARALQQYGMVLGDTAGGFTFQAVNEQSFDGVQPYPASWGKGVWADISKIPFAKLKVLPLADSKPKHDGPPIANRCTTGHFSWHTG